MIKRIYSKYFQKSRSFLYPLLGIKKNDKFSPTNTYLSIKDLYDVADTKFICVFENTDTEAFKYFETKMLIENPLFFEKLTVGSISIYVFDYEIYTNDWFNFILGKYSKLSNVVKRAIKTYYGENSPEYAYMDTYLHPKEYYNLYAELLDISVDDLKKGVELCDCCDLNKETLIINEESLNEIKKKSLSL
jgi:hypothetical protein